MTSARIRAAVARGGKLATRLVLVGLVQCSALGAFEGPQPTPATHSLCYNRASTSPDRLHALATTACNGGAPRFLAQSFDISACPLLVPMRLAFACGS